jgi:hypothetical protein
MVSNDAKDTKEVETYMVSRQTTEPGKALTGVSYHKLKVRVESAFDLHARPKD